MLYLLHITEYLVLKIGYLDCGTNAQTDLNAWLETHFVAPALAGCDIGVRFSVRQHVRPSIHPSVHPFTI